MGWAQLIGKGAEEQAEGSRRVATLGDELGRAASGGLNAEVEEAGCGPSDAHHGNPLPKRRVVRLSFLIDVLAHDRNPLDPGDARDPGFRPPPPCRCQQASLLSDFTLGAH